MHSSLHNELSITKLISNRKYDVLFQKPDVVYTRPILTTDFFHVLGCGCNKKYVFCMAHNVKEKIWFYSMTGVARYYMTADLFYIDNRKATTVDQP